jgi:hypothetical protein
MAAQTQQLEPTHRAYSTLSSMRFRRTGISPVGQLPNGARQRRAASCERRGRGESRTHLGAESDPFRRRAKQHRAASKRLFYMAHSDLLEINILSLW